MSDSCSFSIWPRIFKDCNMLSELYRSITSRYSCPSVARSTARGLEKVLANPPEVLISDIEMPFEDGYSFIRKVRALPNTGATDIFAIALTAHANKDDQARALAAGFQLHLRKPIEPTMLVEKLSELVKKHAKS